MLSRGPALGRVTRGDGYGSRRRGSVTRRDRYRPRRRGSVTRRDRNGSRGAVLSRAGTGTDRVVAVLSRAGTHPAALGTWGGLKPIEPSGRVAAMTTTHVALLGTGIMGSGMARNIAAAGLPLIVWNRTREKAAGLGAEVGGQSAGGRRREGGHRDHGPAPTRRRRAGVREAAPAAGHDLDPAGHRGRRRLRTARRARRPSSDSCTSTRPCSAPRGPPRPASSPCWRSGPDEARRPCQPVLDAIGAKTLWLGAAGAGSRLKLVANAWVLTVVEGVAESLTLARALGLDPQQFLDVVKGGAAGRALRAG